MLTTRAVIAPFGVWMVVRLGTKVVVGQRVG